MPKSRKRRRRPRPSKSQRRRRRQRELRDRTLVATLRPGQDIKPFLTDDDRAAMEAEMDAAARGDAVAALQHHMEGLVVEESVHPYKLREIADLADDAPGWIYSRWCVEQAYRWMLVSEDPRTDDLVRVVLAVAHLDHVEQLADDPEALKEYGTLVAASDWLAEQLCVYTGNGLVDFLDLRAQPGLIARADQVAEWAAAPMGVYEFSEMRGDLLVVRDHVTDDMVELLNLGAFSERETDFALGRVVPISQPPYRMFDSRPVPLDEATASGAAAAMRGTDQLGWLDAISLGRDEGRLERRFSWRQTMFTSDIVIEPRSHQRRQPDEMPGRVRDLVEAGLPYYVANGVTVAEIALTAASTGDQPASVVGPHLSAVLVDSQIFAATLEHCTEPQHEGPWRRLAGTTSSPVRERCLDLAARCRRRAA